jgi:hypothetical protein
VFLTGRRSCEVRRDLPHTPQSFNRTDLRIRENAGWYADASFSGTIVAT